MVDVAIALRRKNARQKRLCKCNFMPNRHNMRVTNGADPARAELTGERVQSLDKISLTKWWANIRIKPDKKPENRTDPVTQGTNFWSMIKIFANFLKLWSLFIGPTRNFLTRQETVLTYFWTHQKTQKRKNAKRKRKTQPQNATFVKQRMFYTMGLYYKN